MILALLLACADWKPTAILGAAYSFGEYTTGAGQAAGLRELNPLPGYQYRPARIAWNAAGLVLSHAVGKRSRKAQWFVQGALSGLAVSLGVRNLQQIRRWKR